MIIPQLSATAQLILKHRLDMEDAMLSVLEDALPEGEHDPERWRAALTEAQRILAAGGEATGLTLDILQEAAEGSTFFCGLKTAVAAGEVSRGQALSYYKSAAEIERVLGVKVPVE